MEFAGIADTETAKRVLEQAGGDINAAAALYLDSLGPGEAGPPPAEEDLRAPDPQYTQTLLSPPSNRTGVVSASTGFPQQNVTALAVESSAGTVAFRGLFELPEGLSCQDAFARARELCRLQKKWLLVNIQQVDAFESLRLNRDVWKAEVVVDLIKDFFIFWQRTNQSEEGQVFCDLYRVTSLPHVCVIDPLTGRCLKSWSTRLLSDSVAVQSEFFEFVEQQQAAEQAKAASQRPEKETPVAPSHPTMALEGFSSPNPAHTNCVGRGEIEKKNEDTKDARHGDDSKPSNYADVNSQLMELRKLREQRRQAQNNALQSS